MKSAKRLLDERLGIKNLLFFVVVFKNARCLDCIAEEEDHFIFDLEKPLDICIPYSRFIFAGERWVWLSARTLLSLHSSWECRSWLSCWVLHLRTQRNPSINTAYNRIYAGVVKDSAPNKIWGKSKQWRMTAGSQCYLQLLDKRSDRTKDWAIATNVITKRVKYHFTYSHGVRISEDHLWWIADMIIEEDRERAAKEAAQMHKTWRIQVNAEHKQKCREDYRDRVAWEFSMIKKTDRHQRRGVAKRSAD